MISAGYLFNANNLFDQIASVNWWCVLVCVCVHVGVC